MLKLYVFFQNPIKYSFLFFFASFLLIVAQIAHAAGPQITLVNPYEGIDWTSTAQHKANLHTHTTQSDGSHNPDVVIDFYHSRGYSILALTDHNLCTWPWDTWNRNPETLGMLAVPGNEYSRHDHVNGFFLCHETSSNSVEQTLSEIGIQGGLAVINHPGRYWSLDGQGNIPESTLQKYLTWYTDYPGDLLVGMEVFNSINRHPNDILLYDALLSALMPERPIWIFANDDMHYINVLNLYFAGVAWTVFPTNDLEESEIYDAMLHGRFYTSTNGTRPLIPTSWNPLTVPVITDMVHDAAAGTIRLSAVSSGAPLPEEDYLWISMGEVVHVGSELNYRNTPGIEKYVRAQLEGFSGTTFTNPFGILSESGTLRVFMEPADALYAGAQWRIDGGDTWYNHGDTVELGPGQHVISFKRISAYQTPAPIVVTIVKDEETVITADDGALYVYDESLRVPVASTIALAALTLCIAGMGWLFLRGRMLRKNQRA